jgi:hypothetical protein
MEAASGASSRRRTRTIGRARDWSSSRSVADRFASDPGSELITANGFSSRRLRARRRLTAASLRASQARW